MLVVTILIGLLLSLAAIAWVVWPLLNRAPAPPLVEDDRLVDLLARKDGVVAALKDLEFDYNVGKLNQEDYERYEQRLRRQAIGLMQQVEQMAPVSTELDTDIEAEIVRRRRVTVAGTAASSAAGTGVPAQPAAQVIGASPLVRPSTSNGSAARFCTSCGKRLEPAHRFCAHCGTPVVDSGVHTEQQAAAS